jgi:hypothetical protein
VANITEAQLLDYLRVFHDEYTGSVERFVPEDVRGRLLRLSLLPTTAVIGYVSTQFGAGYEYVDGDSPPSTRRSSSRIEDLFVNGPNWLRGHGPMLAIGGPYITIQGGTFVGGFPFRFTVPDGDVQFIDATFKAGRWSRHVRYAHLFANRDQAFWSEAEAVRRAKDEVLQAAFDIQQSAARGVDLGTYLTDFKQRTVLLLGDFRQGRDRLERIKASVAQLGYRAVLLDELPEEPNYDLRQKFQAVASGRFNRERSRRLRAAGGSGRPWVDVEQGMLFVIDGSKAL